jgi:hypothetical protein
VTRAPRWLDHQWKGGEVPQSLRTGSLEGRATRILAIAKVAELGRPLTIEEWAALSGATPLRYIVQNEQRELETIKPTLLKVLALDLAAAAAEQRKWPKPVEALLVHVLGLRSGHEAGGWIPWDLERRGRRKPEDIESWSTAALIDRVCYEKYGKVKSQHALARELKRQGFQTAQRRIGEWRKGSYGEKPDAPTYVPPDAPTMTPQEDRRVPPFLEWRIKVLPLGIEVLPPEE